MVFHNTGLIHMISNAGLMVQFILLLLLFFSITSWAIMFIKHRYIKKAFKESVIFTNYFWKSRDLASAFSKAKNLPNSPVARIYCIGYTELRKLKQSGEKQDINEVKTTAPGFQFTGIDNVERALRRAANTEITQMMQMVPFLATTGNTTPFIGLFGTVWGIMNSFHGIGVRGSASLAVVAPGISEALIATAAGLGAAIPAVIAFNYFMNKIRIIESEMQSFSADFLNIIERDIIHSKESI